MHEEDRGEVNGATGDGDIALPTVCSRGLSVSRTNNKQNDRIRHTQTHTRADRLWCDGDAVTLDLLPLIAPALWIQEDNVWTASWGEGPSSTELTVMRYKDGYLCKVLVGIFKGEGVYDDECGSSFEHREHYVTFIDQIPGALRDVYADVIIGIGRWDVGDSRARLESLNHAPLWLRAGILPEIERRTDRHVRDLENKRAQLRVTEQVVNDVAQHRDLLASLLSGVEQ